jgi:hypothetical protein
MDVKDGESRMITDEAGAAPRRPHPACAEGADEGRHMLAIVVISSYRLVKLIITPTTFGYGFEKF